MTTGILNSRRWKRLSNEFRQRHPTCRYCGKPTRAARHVESVRTTPARAFDATNLEPVCRRCLRDLTLRPPLLH